MKEIIISKKFRKISIVLIILIILITVLPYSPLSRYYSKIKLQRNLTPLLWSILCVAMWFFVPRIHPVGKIKKRDTLLFDAIICVTILLACRFIAGLFIDELGKSPYNLSLNGIISNLKQIGPELVAKELIRGYCIGTFCRKGSNKVFYLITCIITISNIRIESIFPMNGLEGFTTFFAERLGPELCINVLLSYLVLYGGPLVSILYLGIVTAFLRFFPVLPNLQWITEGVICMSIPIMETFYITSKYDQNRHRWVPKESVTNILGWTITLSTSIAFIWFVVGAFPIYPSVIATGSMRPLISEGDVIIIDKITEEKDIYSLIEGDIIQFTRDDILITHRIINVIKDEFGNMSFKTKGDNNSSADSRIVLPNEIKGTLVKVIPKLGIPTLWVKSREQNPEGVEQ